LEENQEAAKQEQQYVAAPANAVVGGDKPGSFRLPGSNTSVAIGGYAKLDLIYDINNFQGNSFGFSAIPLNAPPNSARTEADGNFRLHARQSRLWVRTWTPTDWGEFATHIEGDFLGAGGNEVFSNSSTFRLRHAYGQLGNVLAGQTWSNFNTPFEWPGTIDFFGTIGTTFIRQAQLRYTAPLGDGMSLAVAIENPENDGIICTNNAGLGGCVAGVQYATAGANGTATSSGVTGSRSTDAAPDITARFQWGADWGTVAVAAVGRYFRVLEGSGGTGSSTAYSGVDDTAFGWGVNVAGVINLPWGKDSVGVQGIYGDGLGRYGIWGGPAYYASNGLNGGAAININTVETWGANAWIEHWWTDSLFSVLAGGYASFNYPGGLVAQGLNDHIVSGHVNLQWQPVSRATIGIEGSYGHRETTAGLQGDATRVQVGFQWGFST
jgi:hypothetical protein